MGMNIATKKKMEPPVTDLRVIHIAGGHVNLLCIDPILVYVAAVASSRSLVPLEVSVHLASLQALTKVVGNWARCKKPGTQTYNAKWGVAFAFKKNKRWQERPRKTKRVSEADWVVCCRKLRTFTDFSGAAVKYLSSNGMGPILEPCAPTLKPA